MAAKVPPVVHVVGIVAYAAHQGVRAAHAVEAIVAPHAIQRVVIGIAHDDIVHRVACAHFGCAACREFEDSQTAVQLSVHGTHHAGFRRGSHERAERSGRVHDDDPVSCAVHIGGAALDFDTRMVQIRCMPTGLKHHRVVAATAVNHIAIACKNHVVG